MKNCVPKLRKKLNLTQQDLATKTSVTRQTIISLEQNRYNPSLKLAHKITKVLEQSHIENVFIFPEK